MLSFLKRLWFIIRQPATHYSLGFLTMGGFIMGIIFWGGFNTALEVTNTEAFCTSCHEMRDNVYQELKPTILISNLNTEELEAFLGQRVMDRYRECGSVLAFDWPSHRGLR